MGQRCLQHCVASQSPALTTQPLLVIPQPVDTDATSPVDDSLTSTTTTSIGSPGLQPINVSKDAMDIDDSSSWGVSHVSSRTSSNLSDISSTETQVTRDTFTLPAVDNNVSPDTNTEVSTTTTEFTAKETPVYSSIIPPTITFHLHPLPALLNDIDVDNVPAFLCSHGKGK